MNINHNNILKIIKFDRNNNFVQRRINIRKLRTTQSKRVDLEN